MSGGDVVYENAQWKLTKSKNTWFLEAKRRGGYWIHVEQVMSSGSMLEHVAIKRWCNMDAWFDVCRKAAEISPWKPSYDLEKKFQEIKDEDSKH